MFNVRTGNNNSSLTIKHTQKTLNGTRNLTQKDIQIQLLFVYEKITERITNPTQHKVSPIHPTPTTPYDNNTPFPQTTIQSTKKHKLFQIIYEKIVKHFNQ